MDLVDDVGQKIVDTAAGERLAAAVGDPGVEDAQPLERDAAGQVVGLGRTDVAQAAVGGVDAVGDRARERGLGDEEACDALGADQIGRASCRERV